MRTIRLFALSAGAAAALLLCMCERAVSPTSTSHQQQDPLAAIRAKIIRAADSLQSQVVALRGKNFKRPVFVSVFTQSQYAAMVGSQIDTTPQSEKDLYNRVFKLEGLLRPNADYFASYDSTLSTETAGFYVPGTDSLYIILGDNATGLTLQDSLTIFHEFVHALQDQYFDLTNIDNQAYSSDQYYASRYVVEGEAELLMDYYWYALLNGPPATTTPILNWLNQDQITADLQLDTMHQNGEPLLSIMPMLWQYYSYGPRFINAIAGTNWAIIDNTIFPALPLRMLEILHPQEYSASNEYVLNTQGLDSVVVNSHQIQDQDEIGELLADVMFREWDFSSFRDIPNGMMADYILAFRNLTVDSLRMIWYTYWKDSTASSVFFQNYVQLVNKKRTIQLPAAVDSPAYAFVNDTVDNIYIEQSKGYVFTIENYEKSDLNAFISQCRAIQPYPTGVLAKARAPAGSKYPRINKHRVTGGRTHPAIAYGRP